MPARKAATRKAATVKAPGAGQTKTQSLPSPPATSMGGDSDATATNFGANRRSNRTAAAGKKVDASLTVEAKVDEEVPPSTSSNTKRKRSPSKVDSKDHVNGEVVNGGWDELPHNLGKPGTTKQVPAGHKARDGSTALPGKGSTQSTKSEDVNEAIGNLNDSSTTEVRSEDEPGLEKTNTRTKQPVATSNGKRAKNKSSKDEDINSIKAENTIDNEKAEEPTSGRRRSGRVKRSIAEVKKENGEDGDNGIADAKPNQKSTSRAKKIKISPEVSAKVDSVISTAAAAAATTSPPPKKARAKKANPYGLSPGKSPFADFAAPTPAACAEVARLLSGVHGDVQAPAVIPPPSLEVTGCGEVPSILDALIRTLLSAATTAANSSRAFQGLVARFGLLERGVGQGSVDWDLVRRAETREVFEAIKSGGLAANKSKNIKAILDRVWEINRERRGAFVRRKVGGENADDGDGASATAAAEQTQGQRDLEIAKADDGVLSLDHMHALSAEAAMAELIKFPGIGVKTASCVLLFCMRRPSFAVDTHVWRLCKWLSWVPAGATRDQTFGHCEVRVPNELKYALHQLFIRHGKTCGRCRAATGEGAGAWDETNCPIEHLVERGKKRRGAGAGGESGDERGGEGKRKRKAAVKKQKKGRGKKQEEWDSEEESEEELSDLVDDDEEE